MIYGIHPIRAALALIAALGTIYMILKGIAVPDGWWTYLGAAVTFYFTAPGGG